MCQIDICDLPGSSGLAHGPAFARVPFQYGLEHAGMHPHPTAERKNRHMREQVEVRLVPKVASLDPLGARLLIAIPIQ